MTIEFGADERIENVSIGDSLSWQVTPNRKATLLFLKPMAKSAADQHDGGDDAADLLLRADGDRGAVHERSRRHAAASLPLSRASGSRRGRAAARRRPRRRPEDFNFDYGLSGAKNLHPVRVFDDGIVTYFQFDSRNAAPAVFVIGADGKEEMANTRIQGDYTIADFIVGDIYPALRQDAGRSEEPGLEQASEAQARAPAPAERSRLTWRKRSHHPAPRP